MQSYKLQFYNLKSKKFTMYFLFNKMTILKNGAYFEEFALDAIFGCYGPAFQKISFHMGNLDFVNKIIQIIFE